MRLSTSIVGLGAAPVCSILAFPSPPLCSWQRYQGFAPPGLAAPQLLGRKQSFFDTRRSAQESRWPPLAPPLQSLRHPARAALGTRLLQGGGGGGVVGGPLAPLRVYLFVAFVGWGKNKMTELIEGMEGQEREALLGAGAGQHTLVIESDVVGGKRFWGEVDKAIKARTQMTHLILNKNFPPGAWEATLRKLQTSCEANGRSLELYAIVPQSAGTERNAFTLLDLAVSAYSVLQRDDHPNLSSKSPKVVEVAALFYRFYQDRDKSGREGFLQRVRAQLTPKVVCVEWLRAAGGGQGPGAQCEGLMRKVLMRLRKGVPEELVAEVEREVRAFMRRPDVIEYMASLRLPPQEVLLSFREGLRAAEQDSGGT